MWMWITYLPSMWIWLFTMLLCLFTYIYFTIATTSGSSYKDNSIDAFIRPATDEKGTKENEKLPVRHEDRYKIGYTLPGRQVLIIYGTEYGFSEEVARYIFDRITAVKHSSDENFFQPRLVNAKHHHLIDWSSEQVCLVVISTSGDGAPPSDAEEFYKRILSSNDQYNHIMYSVLAMGDSNYPQFCKTGRTLDTSFRNQSAACMVPCHEVDMEDWSVINEWLDKVVDYIQTADIDIRQDYLDLSDLEEGTEHDRHHPFMAKLKVKKLLTVSRSSTDDKETIHCEFDIAGSGLNWISGDALGIYPQNNPHQVEEIMKFLQFSSKEILATPSWAFRPCNATDNLKSLLLNYYDLKHVKPELLWLLIGAAETTVKDKFMNILENGVSKTNTAIYNYLQKREVIDVIKEFSPVYLTPVKFLSCMKSLQPRYYSISSSPMVDSNTISVTAAVVRYDLLNKTREGVTTTYLQDRLSVPDSVPVFISRNPDFRLPSNLDLPVILIGPGTGIAPFRAFIQERELQNIKQKTYLYFGCRYKQQDYLYREELEKYKKNGTICLRVAFSREQKHKIYVQDLLQQDSAKIWKLLTEDTAHMYVCGDAKRMAHDVHKMLLYIAQMEGNMNMNSADNFLKSLEDESRYQKDVWIS